jgi:hypothetical protein
MAFGADEARIHARLLMITRIKHKTALLTLRETAGRRPAVAHDHLDPTLAQVTGGRKPARP